MATSVGQTGGVNFRKWYDSSQPQTLQGAQVLLYVNCFWLLLSVLRGGITFVGLIFLVGLLYGALGIANEKKWGYRVAVVLSVLVLVLYAVLLAELHGFATVGILNLLFEIALVAMLLHPQSRAYQRLWFK